jgi:hypothetical protein
MYKAMKTIKILTVLFVLSFFACKKDDKVQIDNSEFVKVINLGGIPEKVEKEEEVLDSSVTDSNMPDGSIWVCTTKKYSITDGNSEFPLFNPNASVIYPGSLLQGNTLSKASPSVIPVKRAGGTISIDVIDGNLQPAFTVDEVTKSKIAEAANNIISGSTGVVPANFNFTAEEVQSSEQLSIELGLNFETQFVQVESQFSFRKDKEYHRFIVKLNQSFYTLSFDIPASVKEIFAPEVTPEELSKYVGPGNPATFISDVTYGRVYYMLIESSASSTEIDAALNASFTTATAGGGVDVNVNSLKSLSDLQIKVVALGGEAQSTFATIGETNIGTLVQMLGASTDIRTGVPISYVVRSVVDKEVVSVKLATEYEVKNCEPLAAPLGEPIAWWDAAVLLEDGNGLKPTTDQKNNPIPNRDALLDYNGRYAYQSGGINEHMLFYRTLTEDYNGTVVKKWPDRSGNKIDANALSGVPDSRPMFIGNAFNNGRPAVEFFRGSMIGEFVYNRLTYSGGIFVNTDYTIFAVISYPNEVNVHWKEYGEWGWRLNVPNNYGYFMKSSTIQDPLKRLVIGFQNQTMFRFSHGKTPFLTEGTTFKPSEQFKVLAFRFSKTGGMSVFQNGVQVKDNITYPGETQAILSYADAVLSAPYKDSDVGLARIRIGEIKVYGAAATDAQVQQETALLNLKYGL